MLLSQITPDWCSLSVFLLLLNIPLFVLGYKKQGGLFTLYSLYTIAVYSFGAWLITDVLPVDVSLASPLAGTDLLLCALFGGMISGVGSGLTIRYGGAIDGIEVQGLNRKEAQELIEKKVEEKINNEIKIYVDEEAQTILLSQRFRFGNRFRDEI